MDNHMTMTDPRHKVRPTPTYLEALIGTWEVDGEVIQMLEEPGTGALTARNSRGEWVNPIPVITRGLKK